jgi:catechol 2,3-dioxygenase-like lactoylglutathione lyase family enzyme
MIAHISIGVRDIDRSKRFYDAALEPLGYKCLRAARTLPGYGYGRDSIALWAANAADVDAFHAAALRCGGHDNGAPGQRLIYGPDYYAAFIIDPDGYRIEAYYGPAEI